MQRLKKLLQDAKGNPANVVIELEQQLEEKEKRIESLISSHFSVAGVLQQISLFMKGDANDLRCQALPRTTRDG